MSNEDTTVLEFPTIFAAIVAFKESRRAGVSCTLGAARDGYSVICHADPSRLERALFTSQRI